MEYMDMKRLTGYIHLSRSTIYKLMERKDIPYLKIGSRTLFDKIQIDNWMRTHEVEIEQLPTIPKFKEWEK